MSVDNMAPVLNIKTWKKFSRVVRSGGNKLLSRLGDFPDSVLIAGCQRSGTTMLSRIVTSSEGMVNYWFGHDDELDAALILSGSVNHVQRGRYCFQTTYLNECVGEYYDHHDGYKLVWVVRQPFSVIHSMLYNWKNFALNELFEGCATDFLDEKEQKRYRRFGVWGVSRLRRACLSYCGKVSQLFELYKRLPTDQLMVVDYDTLVSRKEELLPKLYRFIDLPYRVEYADMIHNKSISKHSRLSKKAHSTIEETCLHTYKEAGKLVTLL
jgi:hypothetical protein